MREEATADVIKDELLRLGVRTGGLLLVHSSLKSLGLVPGGAKTVIQGLLKALGPEGTLLMPALSYDRVTSENPVFDLNNTPGNVGLIAETFRTYEITLRSLHPTHSICACGRQANELIEAHGFNSTPCGEHSPLRAIPERGGQILMLGCGLEPNTTMHAVEEMVEPEYLYDDPIDYHLILGDGRRLIRRYRPHNFRGWRQRYERIEDVMKTGLRRGRILQADCHLMEAIELWKAALVKLREDSLYFVERKV